MRKICLIIVVFGPLYVTSCAPYPNVPYYEIDEAIDNAESEEEAEYYRERTARIEAKAEKAGLFLEAWMACERDGGCSIQCVFSGPVPRWDERRMRNMDIPTLVRWYDDHRPPTCGFKQSKW